MNTPASVTITPAPGATPGVCNITYQIVDVDGSPIAAAFKTAVWLSDLASGLGVSARTPAGGQTRAGGAGVEIHHKVSQRCLDVLTGPDGRFVLMVSDAGKHGYYPAAAVPGTGVVVAGERLVPGDYA